MAGAEETRWARPSAKEGQSEVWDHFDIELPNKNRVKCKKCPAKIFKYSGSTRVMWYHLEHVHHIHKSGTQRQSPVSVAVMSNTQGPTATVAESASVESASAEVASTPGQSPTVPAVTANISVASPPVLTQMSLTGSWARDDIQPIGHIFFSVSGRIVFKNNPFISKVKQA